MSESSEKNVLKHAVTGLAFILMSFSFSNAQALGLSEIRLNSSLNQPLDATIQISASPDELAGLEINLATDKEFKNSGLKREAIIDLINIKLINNNGKAHIKLGSKTSIREPLLDLVLKASWANGRILKSYSVFLSP